MITLKLLSQIEKVNPDNPWGLKHTPLYHQVRTLEALRAYDLVMNSYNTGTGKTVAALFHLFELDGCNKNVLFIAPTNALITQHTKDIEDFVEINKLNFKVLRVTAADIRALHRGQSKSDQRPGEILQRLISNYLEFEANAIRRQPIVLVVNPDIFYYALYFRYGAHDRRNVFQEFLRRFDYIVVDEFHYYDYKQLSNFLFAFALFDQLGYFEVKGRKICLLSATPSPAVEQYLDQVFGSRWTHVSPQNEPPASETYEQIPTLTPLELTIQADQLSDWTAVHRTQLADANQDGAIISSSLAQINQAYNTLRGALAETALGRITGPEAEADRLAATARRLILATPTVDIGYNFVKFNKTRQNIDFVVFDARFGDELIQRLGRAGRVLGKAETDIPSRATVLLREDAANALSILDGQTLSRAEFSRLINECDQLPPKHTLTGYIKTYAMMESFWPIYQFGKMLPPNLQNEVEALFERIRAIFAPRTHWTPKKLTGFFVKLESRRRWLAEKNIKFDQYTAQHVADWLTWLKSGPAEERVNKSDVQPHLKHLLGDEAQRQALRDFVESQLLVTEALFSFRDSFQGPTAVIYDPGRLLSSQSVNSYDLFHLIRNFKLSQPLTRAEFKRLGADTDLKGDFYFQLLDFRDSKLNLELCYSSEDEPQDFECKWCNAPVALKGVWLQVREQKGDVLAGGLNEKITNALINTPIPMLIVPPDSVGAMISKLRSTNLWSYTLNIEFPDGALNSEYKALLGAAAFMGYAELRGHFFMKERLKSEPIIV